MVFGSYFRIRAAGPDSGRVASAVAEAFREVHRLDTLWSQFLPEGEISKLNAARRMKVSSKTAELVKAAIEAGVRTQGAFDLTVEPLVKAWGFYDEKFRVPNSTEIAHLVARVDFRKVAVRGDSVILDDSVMVDLGGIAVGQAVEQVVELLKGHGVLQGLVDGGGDIRVFGNRVWRIGLQNPRGNGVLRVFCLRDRAVATSGDYQKFFEADGRRYSHIMNPRTGYPPTGCASVTVFAPDAVAADYWSTALFVLGPEGLAVLSGADSGLGAVMLVPEGRGLKTLVVGRIE